MWEFRDGALFGLKSDPSLSKVVGQDNGIMWVIEKGVWADSHVSQGEVFIPLDADVVIPLAVVEEVEDIPWSSSAGAVMGFGREILPKACDVAELHLRSFRDGTAAYNTTGFSPVSVRFGNP